MREFILVVLILVVMIFIIPLILMVLWNLVMPDIFNLPEINIWKSIGLWFLSWILFRDVPQKKAN